jgi:hypothetical protein
MMVLYFNVRRVVKCSEKLPITYYCASSAATAPLRKNNCGVKMMGLHEYYRLRAAKYEENLQNNLLKNHAAWLADDIIKSFYTYSKLLPPKRIIQRTSSSH